MKNLLLIILFICLSTLIFAQITFDKGYFIKNNDEKVICLIKNEDWSDNPIKIEYQLSEQGITKSITIDDIKEFGIDKTSKYIRYKGKVEVSSDELNKLTEKKEPIFEVQTIFLQVLVDGTATLYYYHDKEKTRFFISYK